MRLTCLVLSVLLCGIPAFSQSLDSAPYAAGDPSVTDLYVDPSGGSDSNSGLSSGAARRTVTSIWNAIPQNTVLSTGVRINLLPGTYSSEHLPNYWENRKGSGSTPIILRAANGFGTVSFSRDINMAGVSYFYLLGVTILNRTDDGYGDAFHCERCDHILLRGNSFIGAPNGLNSGTSVAHETIKINQSQYIYLENNNIQGAEDNAIDFVAVQHGHIRANRIHNSGSWCTYAKGGSSYLLIESNIVHDCGEGGITAGQGTGFEFMEAPWLRFEANYLKIVNNVIYSVQGAALGVNGGYNILIAHNTAYRIGSRSHLLEVVYGERSCDGDVAACTARQNLGGWGPTQTGYENSQPIGNSGVRIFNNVFANPAGFTSGYQHLAVYGPRTPTAPGIPSPQTSDFKLTISGNVFWNGTAAMPIGIESNDQGCQPGNPTCDETIIRSANWVNTLQPEFASATAFDFRPAAGSTLEGVSAGAVTNFEPLDAPLNPIPEGNPSNLMVREFSGSSAGTRPPGAFVASSSSLSLPTSEGVATPGEGSGGSGINLPPTISRVSVSARRSKRKIKFTITMSATDDAAISSASARIREGRKNLKTLRLTLTNGRHSGTATVKTRGSRFQVMGIAKDAAGLQTTRSKDVRVR